MKDYKRNQIITVVVFLAAVTFLILNITTLGLPEVFTYVAVFLIGATAATEVTHISFYKQIKQAVFLENRLSLWNSISYRVKKAGELSFSKMPLGIIVFDDKQSIEWANDYAKEMFLSPLVERDIVHVSHKLSKHLCNKEKTFTLDIYGRIFSAIHLIEDNVVYFQDITNEYKIKDLYHKRLRSFGIINLDNLAATLGALDAQEKSLQVSNLIGILSEWAEKYNISLTGFSEERYLIILDQETVETIMQTNFDILDSVKEYCVKENLRLTASIGIACEDCNPITLMEMASEQLQLALNRGGNQAVVKIKDQVHYFGAKSESFEARTPVSVRLKAEELRDNIKAAKQIIVMSHRDMDADAFGAALLMAKIVKAFNKPAWVVIEEDAVDSSVQLIYQSIQKEHINLLDNFISVREALSKINDDTLLILVDCQYQNILLDERIYKKAKKIAIVDHHRRNSLAISNFMYLYTQPSASSSVELLVEMMNYFGVERFDISSIEATWMLLGVSVDTNNFVYRTSSRTFSALAKLQTYGAEMSKVQKYLRENIDEFTKKVDILNGVEIVDGSIAIAMCDDAIYERSFLAKIANDVVLIKDIKIAFCIGRIEEDTIGISARSLDDVNVQVIMERLGGGGHFSNAATQIKNVTKEDARTLLIKNLRENQVEGDSFMKVILTKDVKGKGKINDIIDIPAGHANYLIRTNQAIEATDDNVKHLEYGKLLEKQAQEAKLKEMQALKIVVEKSPITISVRVGKNGKLFGSVTTKQIVEAFKAEHQVDLDKRKILSDKEIESLGTYQIPIQLHKEVIATMVVYVVEKV